MRNIYEKQISRCKLIKLYDLLGKKWTIPLFHTLSETPKSYNEIFNAASKKVNPTLLSKRLKDLENLGIIKKVIIKKRKCYVLTRLGVELEEVLHNLKKWAVKNGLYIPEKCKTKCLCDEVFG